MKTPAIRGFLLCPGSQLVVKMWAEIEPFLTTFSTFSDVLSMVADVGTVLAVDMVNRAHTTVCRVSTGAILEIRHNQTRMTGKVLRQLANVSRPLRPRTARSWQRETVTFRYAFHVAEVLTVAAFVMVDDVQNPYKTRTGERHQ